MLPSDLLIHRVREGGSVVTPRRLKLDRNSLGLASELIRIFEAAVGTRRADLTQTLSILEGEDTAFKVKRGLAHILANDFAEFEIVAPVEPPLLRRQVFAVGANGVPSRQRREQVLRAAAELLQTSQNILADADAISAGLYADLPENHVLTTFEPPTPEALVHRYNLAQAQGVFYRAFDLTITAHRNEPGQYKQLFRYIKLFQLMTLIEGDAEHGFTLRLDGPASLFNPSTRYGLAMAKLLPALLHVTRWSLSAKLKPRRDEFATGRVRETPRGEESSAAYELEAGCGLVSHYKPGKEFDSILEESFANRWAKLGTDWRLEREVDLVPVPGSAIIPDFRLVHPDGRSVLLEIVGFWRPEYLRKKFALLRRAGRADIVLAVSERLNLDAAGVDTSDFADRIVWFKGKLEPKAVLERVEAVAQ